LARFRVYAYDVSFVEEVKRLAVQVNVSFGLSVSEGEKSDRVTGTREHRFEFGGPLAVKNLNMSLANSPEGLHFIAGLWDADGGWYTADESHPLGQPRFFGGWHKVYRTKCTLRDRWSISTGKIVCRNTRGSCEQDWHSQDCHPQQRLRNRCSGEGRQVVGRPCWLQDDTEATDIRKQF